MENERSLLSREDEGRPFRTRKDYQEDGIEAADSHGAGDALCIAAVNSSHDELMESSSGGVFSLIARHVLDGGGVVFGQAFTSPSKVECVRIDDMKELHRLRGSKYVQSDMGTIMRDVLNDLMSGREVLFSGTPCQVAGLRSFLTAKGVPIDRLLLIDIVCHGVPSPEFFADCIAWESRGGRLNEVSFRDKREGWGCGGTISVVSNVPIFGTPVIRNKAFSPKTSYYYERFLAGDIYRESCYCCPYACGLRPGDITLGDFWGIDYGAANLNPSGGISLVIVNTARGEMELDVIKNASRWSDRPLTEAIAGNDQLRHPTMRTSARDTILKDWKNRGIDALESEFFHRTAWSRRVWLAKRVVKKLLKGMLNR